MFDFIVFLVLAGLALLFRWVTNQGSDESEKPTDPRNEPPSRGPAESEEERVRRFLEALGVPQGTAPPPPVKPRPVRPRRVVTPQQQTPPRKVRRPFVQPLPPLVTTPEEPAPPPSLTGAPAAQSMVFEKKPGSAAQVSPPATPAASVQAIVRQTAGPTVAAAPLSSLGELLRSRDSVRQAIILREVLGPARGLQPLAQAERF